MNEAAKTKIARTFHLFLHDPRSRARRALLELGKRVVVAVLLLGMLMLSPGAPQFVMAQVQPDPYEEALAKLDRFMELLQELRDQIDRTQFDVDALSFELAFEEPETIAEWVRENIAFEQYPGLLRGPQGTLMSRAGNALDQAVLLAKLLNDAGYEASVVRGNLSATDAENLLLQMTVERKNRPPTFVDEGNNLLLEELKSLSKPLDPNLKAVIDEALEPGGEGDQNTREGSINTLDFIEKEVNLILQTVDISGTSLEPDTMTEQIIAEAQDYHWVQFRTDQTEGWKDAHSAFLEASQAPSVQVLERYEESIPQALLHKFSFRVVLERFIGDQVDEVELIPTWERPVANLIGQTFTFSNLPDGLQEPNDYLTIEEKLHESRFFIPVVSEGLEASKLFFDLDGNAVPAEAAASPYAAIFQELNQKAQSAVTALSNLDAESSKEVKEAQGLISQYVEYKTTTPDGLVNTYRKPLVVVRSTGEDPSLIPPLLTDEEIRWQLMTTHAFMVAVSEHPQGYIIDETVAQLLEMRPYFQAAFVMSAEPSEANFTNLMEEANTFSSKSLTHLELYDAFELSTVEQSGYVYRSGPTLVIQEIVPDESLNLMQSLDVLQNPQRALELQDEKLVYALDKVARVGVWESFVESLSSSGDIIIPSAFDIIVNETSTADLVSVSSEEQLANTNLPLEALAPIRQDLERGFHVLIPASTLSNTETVEQIGWWRFDPITGNTLARRGDGRGASAIEKATYLMLLNLAGGGILIALSIVKIKKCWGKDASYGCYICGTFGAIFGGIAIATGVVGSTVILTKIVITVGETFALTLLIADLASQLGCELLL